MKEIVCAALIEGEKILLVRRAPHRKWSPHLWDLVGGHVEKGEELEVALVRECREEVGLKPLAFSLEATLFEDSDDERLRDTQLGGQNGSASGNRAFGIGLVHRSRRQQYEASASRVSRRHCGDPRIVTPKDDSTSQT
jgi:8-oxo-dGTP pyrophosphatase MutT (NUDIX family)